ncbi:DUF4381 domain-containing protein [Leucothrix arctica]|uniref:DUF4381 domain-containing protein n=1 Tax=Leucothrix arctica TaxID=1481894 RepID=A0A317C7D4_9GAMM|nr:DUF4381 domain-containing protein [Leucothrix arctica]PWQ94141.1 DUF4381 domain-containing protein [Leucothrix arctica]
MNPLDQLKDIHLPSEVNWWPLSVGWCLAGLIVLALVISLVILFKRYLNKKQLLKTGLEPIDQLVADQSLSAQDWLNELSILLRRIAINVNGRSDIAGLVGNDWLAYLDDSGNTREFSEGPGQVLAKQPYQPAVEYDREAIATLSRAWVKEQYKRGQHA